MDKGFVVLAQNTEQVDYVTCAEALAISLKRVMPDAKISLISNNVSNLDIWDKVIPLPFGDLEPNSDWKLGNDWQVYDASPYEYTIKLEADMFIPRSIDYYWDVLKNRDLVISSHIRNYKQEISNVQVYRGFVTNNQLPNCYNGLTYFKKTHLAKSFFIIVKNIFEDWEFYKRILRCDIHEKPTTDWVYSIASHILGEQDTLLPSFVDFSFVHMKPFINELGINEWSKILVYELLPHTLRINTYPQLYPFHYIEKKFATEIIKAYGK